MKIFTEERGLALPLVLTVLLVVTILGSTLYMLSMNETRQVAMDENRLKAHYVARSGAHAVAVSLIDNPGSAEKLIESPASDPVEFGEGTFEVLVYGDADYEVHVESTGTVNDARQTVIVTVANSDESPLRTRSIEFPGDSGAAEITGGNVYYSDTYDLNLDIIKHGDLIFFDREFPAVVLPCDDSDSVFYGSCPLPTNQYVSGEVINSSVGFGNGSQYADISTNNDMVIKPDGGNNLLVKANTIKMGGNSVLRVTLDNNIVAIVADEFDGNRIAVDGAGYLLFYVNQYKSGGNFDVSLDTADDIHVNVFITTGGTFDLRGTPNFTGVVYAPHATVDLRGGGGRSLNGWVITENFFGGAHTSLNYRATDFTGTALDLRFYVMEKWRYDTQ